MKFRRYRLIYADVSSLQNKAKDTRFRNLTLLFTSSLTIMSAATIAPALPQMSAVFSDTPRAEFLSKLILTLPTFFIAIIAPYAGKFVDRHGRIRLLLLGMLVYALAGSSGFFLNDLYQILAGRIILGLAIGVIMTVCITLIGDYFEGEERQRFVGIQVSFVTIGGVIFIGLGGFLADISWRSPFLIYYFSLVLLPFAWHFLHEPERHQDGSGERISILADKELLFLLSTTFCLWVLFFMIPVQLPFYIKQLGIERNALIGAAIAVNSGSAAISSAFYSRLKKHFSFPRVFSIGFVMMAAGYFWIWHAGSFNQMIFALILSGMAMGWVIPNTTLWIIHRTSPQHRGQVMGILTTFRFLGQFCSPIIIQPLLLFMDLRYAFLVGSGGFLILAMVYLPYKIKK